MGTPVCVVMGSDSDYEHMKGAWNTLASFAIEAEVRVLSAHRTPDALHEFIGGFVKDGGQVVIAGAGGAAHLAGVCASLTRLPIIGVPIPTKVGGGLDSLLSTVQMPPGVPVATVATGGSKNAALLAVQILSLSDADLAAKLDQYRADMAGQVEAKNRRVQELRSAEVS